MPEEMPGEKTVERTEYLRRLAEWRDKRIIKVITGIRRCGKSVLLRQYQERLRADGVDEARIISLNLEDLANEDLLDYRVLHQHITGRLVPNVMNYIFLDEIQNVPQFEKAVDSLLLRDNVDIYLTGSNAFLLSGELATLLSGRYVEIPLLPLSFAEYRRMRGIEDAERAFAEYLTVGSLPYATTLADDPHMVDDYLEGIYNTIIVKDIEERERRRERNGEQRRITDITLLKNVARFLASSIGSRCKSVCFGLHGRVAPAGSKPRAGFLRLLGSRFHGSRARPGGLASCVPSARV